MDSPVKIVALLTAHPGKTDELYDLLVNLRKASRNEPGNLRWDIWKDQTNPSLFVLDELYKNNQAVGAHRETPHFKNYLSKINDLADRKAFVLDSVHSELHIDKSK